MLIEGLILGIIIGILRGGSLSNLVHQRIRYMSLVFVALFLQLGLDYAASQQILLARLVLPLHAFSYVLLFSFIFLNWDLPGMKWFAVGTALNFLVIVFNQGTMPVNLDKLGSDLVATLEQGLNATHSIMGEDTRLNLLGDSIYLPYPRARRISPGDILLSIGLFLFLLKSMTVKFIYKIHTTRGITLAPYSLKTGKKNDKIK